ncbi:MAG: hypothetical protein ACE5KZ_08985 [Candidatus Scalinduaceae bacterium]
MAKDKIDYYKYQSDKAAHELSFERNSQEFEKLVADILKHEVS